MLQGDLKHVQGHLRALMEKMAYDRTWHDFGPLGAVTRARRPRLNQVPTYDELERAELVTPVFDEHIDLTTPPVFQAVPDPDI